MARERAAARGPASVDPDEIARFSALAETWWDPDGPMRPLHRLNPVRLAYIRDRALEWFALDGARARPLAGLRLLDLGCGGGLVAEPMARLGARVVGLDASEKNVAVARLHGAAAGLAIDYRLGAAEDLVGAEDPFDIVLNLEIVEHVADLDAFLGASGALLAPGGCTVVATLNRTLKALAFAKVGAEYVLGWLPRGTHDWRRFVRPSELAAGLRRAGLTLRDLRGVSYSPVTGAWRLGHDLAVNYMVFATKE